MPSYRREEPENADWNDWPRQEGREYGASSNLRRPRREEVMRPASKNAARVLVIDVGGTHVKVLATGHHEPREIPSGLTMTPDKMVRDVKRITMDWKYDRISIGFPGPVIHGRPLREPHNLGYGWVGFNFRKAFGCPVKVINDAAMQALGSYQGGRMLFLGLGTGLGAAMIVSGLVVTLVGPALPHSLPRCPTWS